MRSRAVRLTLTAFACLVIGAAALFLVTTEQDVSRRRSVLARFDRHGREALVAVADARAGQQAYIAAGQDAAFWQPRVTNNLRGATETIDTLRQLAASEAAGKSLLSASAGITEFGNIDKRAREYLEAGEPLMASDIVFTEGVGTAITVGSQVEGAITTEDQAFDEFRRRAFQREVNVAAAATVLAVMLLIALGVAPRRHDQAIEPPVTPDLPVSDTLSLRVPSSSPESGDDDESGGLSKAALRAAAALCTDLGQMQSLADLQILIGRAAHLMDASGLIVWLGSPEGADLRPVLAHGYSEQVLALMRAVPRTADNAAAAAYRSGILQVVRSDGASRGAVVAPLRSPEGCIGALAAEIKDGRESSDPVQALASIIAAQLAGVLMPAAAAPSVATSNAKAAS